MVVTCRTGQLLKSSKNVAATSTSIYNSLFGYKKYSNYGRKFSVDPGLTKHGALLGLYCDCRRFHSTGYFQSSRESRAKLTPQEILLINVGWSTTLELPQSLDRFERAVFSEDPVNQLNELISTTLSRKNVQSTLRSTLDSTIGDLNSRLANQDLLEVCLNLLIEYEGDRLAQLEAKAAEIGDDIEALVKLFNNEIGATVLVLANDTLAVSADALGKVFEKVATAFIRQQFKDNLFLQLSLIQTVKNQVKNDVPVLRAILANNTLPLSDLKKLIAATSVPGRSKRDLSFPLNIIVQLVRAQLTSILTPIQTSIDEFLSSAATLVLTFYVSDEPSIPVLAVVTNFTNTVVLRVAEVIVTVQETVDTIFYNILNGTDSSSRRRRDIELGNVNAFDFDEFGRGIGQRGLEISHRRVTRSINIFTFIGNVISAIFTVIKNVISAIWSLITNIFSNFTSISAYLNTLLKNVFISYLSDYYETIGELVTYPLRYVVNYLINQLFPCSSCSSIV